MAKIYSYASIKMQVSCLDYLKRIGVSVNGAGRCKATWRGGTHYSVHVEPAKWFDHVEKKGGSVIDLCAVAEFGGDTIRAVQRLGDMFGLEPITVTKSRPKKTRAQFLVENGYSNTATYDYTDENGNLVYSVARYEKSEYGPGEKKEFIQRTPEHEGLDADTPRLPYNLPAVVNSPRVCVVEGEKDVETLRGFGIVGTTNSGGASTWSKSMNKWFSGKEVVVLPDNDESGEKHCKIVVSMLKPVAKSVKVVRLSQIPKGDVTDWVQSEGGTGAKLLELMASAQEVDAEIPPDIAIAKAANSTPFMNYVEVGFGRHAKKVAVSIEDLVKECHRRFLGFPKKIGETLFDWCRDEGRVKYLHQPASLFGWMALLSKHNVVFERGAEFVGKSEFYEAMLLESKQYSMISNVPHYPIRKDVFYTYGKLPPPDITHSSFWRLVSMFNPCSETHRTILAAFLCAPLFYEQTADRPLWVIDTDDQQGSGKTSLVKLCAYLYGSEYISIDVGRLDKDIQQERRRLISSDARSKRIVVFDNITKTLNSPNLASLVTESYITGLAPYGRGEETRPNDLTYVVTVNNANLGDDIASRAYTVRLAKVRNARPTWYREVVEFIDANRLQVLSDIIHMIDNNLLASSTVRHSRFGRFDSKILSAVCRSEKEYIEVDAALTKETDESNTDADHGVEFLELFLERMRACTDSGTQLKVMNHMATADEIREIVDPSKPIFIQSADVDWMLDHSDGELQKWKSRQILGLIKNRHVQGFDPSVQRINNSYTCFNGDPLHRYRGFLYRPDPAPGRVLAQVLHRSGANFKVIAIVPFVVGADATREQSGNLFKATVTETQTVTATQTRTFEVESTADQYGPDPSEMF